MPIGAPEDLLVRMAKIVQAQRRPLRPRHLWPALTYTLEHADVYLAKPSLSELRHLAGDTLNEGTAREAAMAVIGRWQDARCWPSRSAPRVRCWPTKDKLIRLPALHVVTKSTVGAGDSFLGAMVWALSEGWDREQRLQARHRCRRGRRHDAWHRNSASATTCMRLFETVV